MKEVIMNSRTIKDTDIWIENYRFEFTSDEKKLLVDLMPERKYPKGAILEFESIKGHPKDAIEMFFSKAEMTCTWLILMKESPSRQDNRNKLQEMLKTFKQSIQFLKRIYNSKLDVPVAFYRELKIDGSSMYDIIPQIHALGSAIQARKSEQHLEILVKIIEEYLEPKKQPGSPGSYVTDFAKHIAYAYRRCFGIIPTTYYDGPFFKIITQLLEIVGIDSKDPSRAVRAAVKSLKTSK